MADISVCKSFALNDLCEKFGASYLFPKEKAILTDCHQLTCVFSVFFPVSLQNVPPPWMAWSGLPAQFPTGRADIAA